MPSPTYYIQECPICGRTLQVRVQYLGREVTCMHCRGEFTACDPDSGPCCSNGSGADVLRRAEMLLESVGRADDRVQGASSADQALRF
ncbi:MAG: response regulator [Pirellulaceae bacterium]|nr:hypothetical protein [Planctomycetales bacterium]